MGESRDEELRLLLSNLEILDPEALERATAIQEEREKTGKTLPLAALLVQEGLLSYGVMEQVLAHRADALIVCKRCQSETGAKSLDPREPFRCPSCGSDVELPESAGELSSVDTLAGGSGVGGPGPDVVGRVLGGCRIGRKIGEGGMGAVYEGTHQFLKRKVAVKILPSYHVKEEGFVQRFLRESRSAAQLNHPNVVQVMDAGQDGEIHYIVMEFVEGKSLYGILKDEGRLRPYKALHYAKQAAMGLAAAAKLGIVHRDIKPDNIRATPDGSAKMADFGLAKTVEGADKITRTGAVVGTPLYMSPEQARAETVDHRSDIYSLGTTLYHLIAGHPPYRGHSAIDILRKHKEEAPKPLVSSIPSCPPEAEALILKMMAKKPEDRFQTYPELLDALDEAILACRSSSASRTVKIRGGPGGGLPRWLIPGIVVAIVAAALLGFWALYLNGGEGDERAPSGSGAIRITGASSDAVKFEFESPRDGDVISGETIDLKLDLAITGGGSDLVQVKVNGEVVFDPKTVPEWSPEIDRVHLEKGAVPFREGRITVSVQLVSQADPVVVEIVRPGS